MSLVQELQRDAMNGAVPVTELLRKALVIARKLKIKDFETWILLECNGYPETHKLPDYRFLSGRFVARNPFYGWIPVSFPDEETRELARTRGSLQPISEFEAALEHCRDGQGMIYFQAGEWEASLEEYAGLPVCYQIGLEQLSKVLDGVRNIILDWSLKLEEDGIIGEGMSFTPEEKQAAATHIYHIDTVGALQSGTNNSAIVNQNIGSDAVELVQALRQARAQLNQLPENERQQAIDLVDVVEGDIVQNKWTAVTKVCSTELIAFLNAVGAGVAVELLKNRLGIG